jgi:transglutaminase-like putative cysteine protease
MTAKRVTLVCVTLTAMLAQWSYALAAEKPLFLMLGLAGAVVSSLIVERRLAGRSPAPRWLLNALVVAAALNLGFEFVRADRQDVISRLSDFLSLVMLIKMLDRGRVRDERQLLALAVFVTIGAVLTGQSLGLGLALLAMTPVAICSVVLLQLMGNAEQELAAMARVGRDRGAVEQRDRWKSLRTARSAWRAGLACVALSAAGGVVVFVVAPRQVASQLSGLGGARTGAPAVTGYRDQFRLGEAGLLSQSSETVMDIVVKDAQGQELRELSAPLYLRGNVLDTYDPLTGAWTRAEVVRASPPSDSSPSSDHEAFVRLGNGSMALGDRSLGRVPLTLEVSQRAAQGSQFAPMFAPLRTVQVKGPGQATMRFDALTNLLSANWSGGRLVYSVVSVSGYTEPVRRVPQIDPASIPPAARDLASRVLSEARVELGSSDQPPEPQVVRAAAQALSAHLRSSFQYTLEMEAPPEGSGVDPLTYFLTQRRMGHCEYFAAAMAAMLQSQGVGARVVTGYVAQEFNDLTSRFVVRQSDAHAWCEVMVEPGRWETFDPTPPAGLLVTQRRQRSVGAWVRQAWEAVEFSWLDNVVAYESGIKVDILGQVSGRRGTEATARLTRSVTGVQNWMKRNLPGDTAVGAGVLAVAGVAALLGVFFMARGLVKAAGWLAARLGLGHLLARWRARAGRVAPGLTTPQTRFYAQMLSTLAQAGLPKPGWVPPQRHALGPVSTASPQAGLASAELTALYYAARFGERDLTGAQRERAAAALVHLQESLEAARLHASAKIKPSAAPQRITADRTK